MEANIAMVALESGAHISTESMLRGMQRIWGDLPVVPDVPIADTVVGFLVGNSQVGIAKMRARLPIHDTYQESVASWMWQDVAKDMSYQAEHFVLAVRSDDSALERIQLLTKVAVVVLEHCDQSLAVLWGAAGHLIPKNMFVDLALAMKSGELPIPLWISVWIGESIPGTSSAYTIGLAQFDLPELEVQNSASTHGELARGLLEVADYLISDRPVVKAGDTFETFWSPSVRVCFAESSFGLPGQVIRLV